MASKTVIWFLAIFITISESRKLSFKPNSTQNLCNSAICKSLNSLKENLEHCVVILGNLEISIMETANKSDFTSLTFPLLREVTGFVMVYRVQGLESLGQLFPNLTRIRGEQLVNNYALTIFEMPSLLEVGLYSLRKIDRGGVIIRGLPQACFLDTIDWKVIAPGTRHVIDSSNGLDKPQCSRMCTCSRNSSYNHCWNIKKCQAFADGFEDVKCHEQCLGCRQSNIYECSTCRHFTHNGECVSSCPNNTIVLAANQYCLTEAECHSLNGSAWNNTCVFECPVDYVLHNTTNGFTCTYCAKCLETCPGQTIRSLDTLQAAEKCVYINGSLTIHIGAIPEAVKELRIYLRRIKEVADFVEIYGSLVITSLDFLSSLNHIKGKKLKKDKYSLMIYDMANLHTLFTRDVIKNLRIDRGTMKMYNNPMICSAKVDELRQLFPEKPSELDIEQDTNGYKGACVEVQVDFQIRLLNETSVVILFSPISDPHIYYTVLYVRIPPDLNTAVVPETCSEFQWFSVNTTSMFGQYGMVQINSLRPASSYAICIETYDPVHQSLARTSVQNFTTPVGTPEPPFLIELVADSHDLVVLRWVDHVDYRRHITRYELDVALIEPRDISNIDYCKFAVHDFEEVDKNRHALVMRPPPEYEKACESMCGVLSSYTAGALVEDFFDVCDHFDFNCNEEEDIRPDNSSYYNYVKTLALDISSPKNAFQVGRLAPYRDYRFRLRACVGLRCSRSAKGVVRTIKSLKADFPTITNGYANETGFITLKWVPPDTTNGPILSYTIEILPKFPFDGLVLPQTWCVPANHSRLQISCIISSKYSARVCTTTLASYSACSEWYTIFSPQPTITWYWWTVAIFTVVFISCIAYKVTIKRHKRQPPEDIVPIVDIGSSSKNESEPMQVS